MCNRPIPGVSAVVTLDDKVLLVKRGKEPYADVWSLPGGSIELGERACDALVREVREETSLEIQPGEVLGVVDVIARGGGVSFHYTVIVFRATLVGGALAARSDATEARWFGLQELSSVPHTEGLADLLGSVFNA